MRGKKTNASGYGPVHPPYASGSRRSIPSTIARLGVATWRSSGPVNGRIPVGTTSRFTVQRRPFGATTVRFKERETGLEPATYGLGSRRSTN